MVHSCLQTTAPRTQLGYIAGGMGSGSELHMPEGCTVVSAAVVEIAAHKPEGCMSAVGRPVVGIAAVALHILLRTKCSSATDSCPDSHPAAAAPVHLLGSGHTPADPGIVPGRTAQHNLHSAPPADTARIGLDMAVGLAVVADTARARSKTL